MPLGVTIALASLAAIGSALSPVAAAPEIVNGRNFAGQFDPEHFAHAAGAVGPTRYIQFVNREFAIYSCATLSTAPISAGTLNDFNGQGAGVASDNPQIIWDAATNRFYYAMTSRSGTTNFLSYGWSKTASPNSPDDFCYSPITLADEVPTSPKLGDSRDFVLVGYNMLRAGSFVDAQVLIRPKPPAGSSCVSSGVSYIMSLRDSANNKVLSPVAVNGIDSWAWGYVVARNFTLPSNKLWLIGVTRGANGVPVLGPAKALTLPFSYAQPPPAGQHVDAFTLDTGDASPSQAVVARNPDRGNAFSLWTQHTVERAGYSAVRWYEINPVSRPPLLLRQGLISAPGLFFYNAAISPDRSVEGTTGAFGDSFVIQFNRSGVPRTGTLHPQIRMGSSFNGEPLSYAKVVDGQAPYSDSTCEFSGRGCLWSTFSACTPDPRPPRTGRGAVWCTNVFAGPQGASGNWRTQTFSVKP